MCNYSALVREKGVEQGLEQGRTEGLEQGRTEGLKQGRTEGVEQGRSDGQIDMLAGFVKDGIFTYEQAVEQAKKKGLPIAKLDEKLKELCA